MKTIAVLLLLTLPFLSCSDLGVEGQPPQIRELSVSEKQLIESNSKFWLKLLQVVDKTDAEKNVFISPLSISFALGMTLNGAQGTTYEEMKSMLEFNDMSLDDINKSYQSLMRLLRGVDQNVRIEIANSIWYRNTFHVEPPFLQTNQTYFDAVVRALNFSSPDAAPTINAWVDENTNGKIKKIVEAPIPDEMLMYLINAIYFKGGWTYTFDKSRTHDAEFRLNDGTTVTCKLMNQQNTFLVYGTERYTVVDLPYSQQLFSMTVVLPQSDININDFIESFAPSDWQEIVENLHDVKLYVYMPRVNVEYDLDLIDPLKALGMTTAFGGQADFRKINSNGSLAITEAKHKTFVEINEEGTEAAAVTSISAGPTSAPPTILINRPFLFVIRERNTGTVLFVGKIMNPNG